MGDRSRQILLMALDQKVQEDVRDAQFYDLEDDSYAVFNIPIQFDDGFVLEDGNSASMNSLENQEFSEADMIKKEDNCSEMYTDDCMSTLSLDQNLILNSARTEENIENLGEVTAHYNIGTNVIRNEQINENRNEEFQSAKAVLIRIEGAENILAESHETTQENSEESCEEDTVQQLHEGIVEKASVPGEDKGEQASDDEQDVGAVGENPGSNNKRERKRKMNVDRSQWKRNYNKHKRMKGEAYLGFTRDKDKSWKNDTQRQARVMGTRCSGKHSKIYECKKITEECRETIFSEFWSQMTWEQKKIYVVNHVQKSLPKRRLTENEDTQKTAAFKYHLRNGETNMRVCKQMFLNTLAVKEWSVRTWCHNSISGTLLSEEIRKKQKSAARQSRGCTLKHDARRKFLESWLDKLPKLPSHYARRDTKKQYLEDCFIKSKSQLYKLYVEDCKETKPLSSFIFDETFDKKKLAIFQPKKNQCDLCYAYKSRNFSAITEEEYECHITSKDRARIEKQTDKEYALAGRCNMITMDLQAVQLCPRLFASKLYFKQKLRVHNFTVYNVATRQCTNFWWYEGEGDVFSSNFASCIIDYLYTHFKDSDKPIILYSDRCGYQNRCSVISNALLTFAVKEGKVIEQKYLCKGHTQMECDTVHSLIERRLDRRYINLPGEYISVTRHARDKPSPLDAKYLTHEFFSNYAWPEFQWYNSIRPGTSLVVDIRCLKYTPEGEIFYKVDFDSEYKSLRRNKSLPQGPICYPKLYSTQPKISWDKYNHLLEIAAVMDPQYTSFYRNLPHDGVKKKI